MTTSDDDARKLMELCEAAPRAGRAGWREFVAQLAELRTRVDDVPFGFGAADEPAVYDALDGAAGMLVLAHHGAHATGCRPSRATLAKGLVAVLASERVKYLMSVPGPSWWRTGRGPPVEPGGITSSEWLALVCEARRLEALLMHGDMLVVDPGSIDVGDDGVDGTGLVVALWREGMPTRSSGHRDTWLVSDDLATAAAVAWLTGLPTYDTEVCDGMPR